MKTTTTINVKKSQLEIKVLAINTIREFAQKIINSELEQLGQFVGKNIFKTDGSFKAKYEHEKTIYKGKLEDGTNYNVSYYFTNHYGLLDLKITLCISGGSYDVKPVTAFCLYENLTTSLFDVKEGILISRNTDYSYLDERYNVEEIQAAAEKIKNAANEYRRIYETMPYIFTDVTDLERLCR